MEGGLHSVADTLPEGFKLDPPLADASTPSPSDLPLGFQLDEEKYGTVPQMALTAIEGGAKGAFGPVATAGEALLHKLGVPGTSPEEQAGREATNPILHGASETLGFAAPAIASLGVSAAAGTGVLIEQVIGRKKTGIDISAFNPERFSR